jgi:hypothetical protein
LFWIDSDMSWKAEDFLKLVALATKMEVVAGAYPSKNDSITFQVDGVPGEHIAINEYGCIPVNGLGLGFCCIQRSVIERLSEIAPSVVFPERDEPIPHIFGNSINAGRFQGEDMVFFEAIRNLGVSVHIDPSVALGHVGVKTYSGAFLDSLQKVTGMPNVSTRA